MERTTRAIQLYAEKVTFERQHAAFSWQRSAVNIGHSVNGSPASLASRLIVEQYNKRDHTEIKRQMSLLPCNHFYEVQYFRATGGFVSLSSRFEILDA